MLKLVVAPALVGAATLAGRRWGERVGGVVSAFPAIVGPVLLVAALQHGTAFGGRAASGTLLGLVALSGFAVAYGRFARHTGWRVSLAAGWGAGAALGVLGRGLAPGGRGRRAGAHGRSLRAGAAGRDLRGDGVARRSAPGTADRPLGRGRAARRD